MIVLCSVGFSLRFCFSALANAHSPPEAMAIGSATPARPGQASAPRLHGSSSESGQCNQLSHNTSRFQTTAIRATHEADWDRVRKQEFYPGLPRVRREMTDKGPEVTVTKVARAQAPRTPAHHWTPKAAYYTKTPPHPTDSLVQPADAHSAQHPANGVEESQAASASAIGVDEQEQL